MKRDARADRSRARVPRSKCSGYSRNPRPNRPVQGESWPAHGTATACVHRPRRTRASSRWNAASTVCEAPREDEIGDIEFDVRRIGSGYPMTCEVNAVGVSTGTPLPEATSVPAFPADTPERISHWAYVTPVMAPPPPETTCPPSVTCPGGHVPNRAYRAEVAPGRNGYAGIGTVGACRARWRANGSGGCSMTNRGGVLTCSHLTAC